MNKADRADLRAFPVDLATQVHERALKRAERRVEEREHLRLELKAREYIHTVHTGIDTLMRGHEMVQLDGQAPQTMPLDRARVQAIKAAMDGSLRLLDRVLPPLKAVEVQDSPERQADATKLTTGELVKMLMRDRAALAEDAEYREDDGQTETAPEAPFPWE